MLVGLVRLYGVNNNNEILLVTGIGIDINVGATKVYLSSAHVGPKSGRSLEQPTSLPILTIRQRECYCDIV